MAAEPHPTPQATRSRTGAPILAALLAALTFAAMLTLSEGLTLVTTIVSAIVLQVVILHGRGVYLRRAGKLPDLPVRWHQFLFCWSTFSGLTYLLADETSTASTLIDIGIGAVFALFMLGVYSLSDRATLKRSPSRNLPTASERADS